MQQHLFDHFSSEDHSNFLDHNFLPPPIKLGERGRGGAGGGCHEKEGGHEKIAQK